MDLEIDSWIVDALIMLLHQGIYVAVVTAAGYPGKPERYSARFRGLLEKMKESRIPKEITDRFLVVGGECNYLFKIKEGYEMYQVDSEEWANEQMKSWQDDEIKALLDVAEKALKDACYRMRLDVQYLRKARAVGCFPTKAENRIAYEALEDVALTVQDKIMTSKQTVKVPFCAFNGNRDVWVDVGDKRIGIEALQEYLGVKNNETCHLGDRFTNTGNDMRARDVAMTVWVTSPSETEDYLELFLRELGKKETVACAEARPKGPKQGTLEWQKAQVVQRNTAA
mmetsp:Transcript_26316/g.41160  ORF Transcript_26316/g.41160 Transcript_26316/m.41160 type:complete len:283 (+) Transcript_26316:1234-2082(+)